MPNFLPILNSELKPESVTLVVSDKMKDRAEWLKKEIAKHQFEILPDIEIGGAETDINAIQDALMVWAVKNPKLMRESVLNATGGDEADGDCCAGSLPNGGTARLLRGCGDRQRFMGVGRECELEA